MSQDHHQLHESFLANKSSKKVQACRNSSHLLDHDYAKDLSNLKALTAEKETENKENVQSTIEKHWQQSPQKIHGCKFCGKTFAANAHLTVSIHKPAFSKPY